MNIITYFIKRPKVVNLLLAFIFLAGTISMFNVQNQGYPAVDFGIVNITTVYPGAAPDDVELKVTNKLEEAIEGISGVKQFNSTSIENLSQISIYIEDRADYEKTVSDIQKAIDQVDDLPKEIDTDPAVVEVNNDRIPVIEIAITGDAPFSEKRKFSLALEKQLRANSLIGSVTKIGYKNREVQVNLYPEKLTQRYVSISDVIQAIQQQNIRVSGGDITTPRDEKKIIVYSEFEKPLDVKDVIVRSGFEGNRVIISDIAEVNDGYETEETITRYNGSNAINLMIIKKEHADILKTSQEINRILTQFKATLPHNIQATNVVDYSKDATNLLNLVKNNAKIGLILVLFALFFFLNFRVALWTALGIPVSVFLAFIIFPWFDITINFISLMGMIIVLGMLVDDAIVVAENIFRLREEGLEPIEAAIEGTKEVLWPVTATVLTTIVAFIPLLAMTGVMGKFMWQMPVVISFILIASLLECLLILPSHMAHTKMKKDEKKEKTFIQKLGDKYYNAVIYTMKHKLMTLLTFIVMFVLSIILLVTSMDFILFDSDDAMVGIIEFETPVGTSLEETSFEAKKIEDILATINKDHVTGYVTTIGKRLPDIAAMGLEANHSGVGNILVHLTAMKSRDKVAKEIMADIQEKIKDLSGFTKIEAIVMQDGPPVGKPITVSIISDNDQERESLAQQMVTFIKKQPGTFNVVDNEGIGKKQIKLKFDHDKMSRYGLNPAQVAQTIRTIYDGSISTQVRFDGEEVNYRVLVAPSYHDSLDVLYALSVPNKDNLLVPLKQVITTQESDDRLVVNHFDGDRSITIYGELDTKVNTSMKINKKIMAEFQPIVDKMPDVRLEMGGEEKDTQESMQSLFQAMILSLTGIYFILVILFNSFSQPFLVMSAIPFTFSGIVYAFFIHNIAFGFTALLGLIGLMGIVVNNALIMISMMNTERDTHGTTPEVIARAAKKRLRPILLTTITTAAGLFPTAYGIAGDNAFLTPMIMAIAWGLIFATVITLFLVPSLYMIQLSVFKRLKKLKNEL